MLWNFVKFLLASQQANVNYVQENEDELGYFVADHPFVTDVSGSAKCPDTIPHWMTDHVDF